MVNQSSLFDDAPSPVTPPPTAATFSPGSGIALTALKFTDASPSAAQQRFNKLLERTEVLARKIEAAQAMADTYRKHYASSVHPLEIKRDALMHDMVRLLDARLSKPGLTRAQQRLARDILCGLAGQFALMGDEAMRDLHDAHSDESLAEQLQAEAQEAQQFIESMLGEKIKGDADFSDADAVLRASLEQLRARAQAEEAAHAAHKTRRTKPAKQKQAEQEAQDANGALRTIYRQLASALHPDRETDPEERARKTTLMSEANAAYDRRDLLALLQLQLRADLADGKKMANMARDKIAALTALLKERVDVLTAELRMCEERIRREFDLPPYPPLTEAGMRRHASEEKQDLQAEIAQMQTDLRRVRDDVELKRWLREQAKMAKDDFY